MHYSNLINTNDKLKPMISEFRIKLTPVEGAAADGAARRGSGGGGSPENFGSLSASSRACQGSLKIFLSP